jgi:hypothetical protein
MHLETAKNEFFKITSDLAQNDNSKKSGNTKEISFNNLKGEYDDFPFVLNTLAPCENFRNFWPVLNSRNLLSFPHVSPEQPPDFPFILF